MKQKFYLDSTLFDFLKGTFLGLFASFPGRFANGGRLMMTLPYTTSPATGTQFELTKAEFNGILDDLAHHYGSLLAIVQDDKTPTTFKESFAHDARKILLVSKDLIQQGLENGIADTDTFAGKRLC